MITFPRISPALCTYLKYMIIDSIMKLVSQMNEKSKIIDNRKGNCLPNSLTPKLSLVVDVECTYRITDRITFF